MRAVRDFVVLIAPLLLATPSLAQRTAPEVPAPVATHVPPLPDSSGWGVHVLAIARAPDGSIWVGTYGDGIFVLRPGANAWQRLRRGGRGSIASDFVHAFAFRDLNEVWYGTIGNGWGVSRDTGRTWRNWTAEQLGRRFLYTAPAGIVTRGDTVFIGTADGITWTADGGNSWRQAVDTAQGLPSRYVLSIAPGRTGGLWVATLRGLGFWRSDAQYRPFHPSPVPHLGPRIRTVFVLQGSQPVTPVVPGGEQCAGAFRPRRRQVPEGWSCMSLFQRAGGGQYAIRQMAGCDGVPCAMATSNGAIWSTRMGLHVQSRDVPARARDVYAVLTPLADSPGDTLFGTACGLLGQQPAACLERGDTTGVRAPAPPRRSWLGRPIALTDQPFIDQTYRYGSTMGGTLQQHQGVEFNNPAGTPVVAVEAGTVVYAGPAEQGALTVAVRHDSALVTPQGRFHVFSVYYHNSALLVQNGQRVARGQPIARVGSTGRASNEHLHFEIHASPVDSVRQIVDPDNRFPPHTRNPELWIEPLPGTGVIAGQVWDGSGRPVQQARIYGIVKPEPQETPFSYAETYGSRTRGDPLYNEHFAVGDVPAGEYVLGVEIEGRRVFRRVMVEPGRVTWVEFRP
ncbi:MAG TPA: M23 family metallopeptidase [Gemmatimonadales bacterium]|nr:M23 family metallopeptidase [Gemmatimonadales bacterium]